MSDVTGTSNGIEETEMSAIELTAAQNKFLARLGKGSLLGPSPEYQGDCVYISAPELHALVDKRMVGRRKLVNPRDTEGHRDNPPYLRFSHRYRILKTGRAVLAKGHP